MDTTTATSNILTVIGYAIEVIIPLSLFFGAFILLKESRRSKNKLYIIPSIGAMLLALICVYLFFVFKLEF